MPASAGGGRWLAAVAWALIALGGVALVYAFHRLNGGRLMRSRSQAPGQSQRVAADADTVRVRDESTATTIAADRPPPKKEENGDPAVEQERWNLPGFLAAMSPVRTRLPLEKIDLSAVMRHESGESLFDFRYYDFLDSGEFLESVSDLENFARAFLSSVSSGLEQAGAVLFLRNRSGQMAPCLEKRGDVFISGAALDGESLSAECLRHLEGGRYVALEDGLQLVFPLPSTRGLAGAVSFRSDRPLFKPEALARTWFRIRKFGEWLWQATVFEQATVDRDTSLNNGLLFHRDLRVEFSLRGMVREPRELTLLQFLDASGDWLWRGVQLRRHFGDRRLYRIAGDVVAMLGGEQDAESIDLRFSDFLRDLREQEAVDVCIGSAALDDDVASPLEWFRRAGAALEDARSEGPNSFRIFSPVEESARFVEDGSLTR